MPGFKSHRGRSNNKARYANRQSGEAQTFCLCGFRLPPASLNQHASVGHWQASVAVTHPPSGSGGSTPSRRTYIGAVRCWFCSEPFKLADTGSIPVRITRLLSTRCDVGSYSQALNLADAGSIPVRVTHSTMWWNWQTRDAQNVVPGGRGSSNLPFVTELLRVGQCPFGPHKPGQPGATPGPAT